MENLPNDHIKKRLRTDIRIVRAMDERMPRSRRLDGDMRRLQDAAKRRIDENAKKLGL